MSDGKCAEMQAGIQCVILRTAGMLILQFAVVGLAQEIVPSPAGSGSSAPPDKSVMAESSQSQKYGAGNIGNGAATQPGRAGDLGDPAFGGQRHPLYRLSRLDTVDVTFTFSPEFNQTLTLQPDGFVALKGAGALLAEGLTLPEMQEAVVIAYRSFLHEPEVTITLKDFDKPYFLASGEVMKPGRYELRGELTINEAVAIAGGFTKQARHSQVILFRRVSANLAESHVIDLKRMLGSRNLSEDLHLQPGDFVFVPQSRVSKIRKYLPANYMSWYMNPLQF